MATADRAWAWEKATWGAQETQPKQGESWERGAAFQWTGGHRIFLPWQFSKVATVAQLVKWLCPCRAGLHRGINPSGAARYCHVRDRDRPFSPVRMLRKKGLGAGHPPLCVSCCPCLLVQVTVFQFKTCFVQVSESIEEIFRGMITVCRKTTEFHCQGQG